MYSQLIKEHLFQMELHFNNSFYNVTQPQNNIAMIDMLTKHFGLMFQLLIKLLTLNQ